MTAHPVEPAPWRRALAWIVVLGVVFVYGYRATNAAAGAAGTAHVWLLPLDAHVPFWAWTLVPYLSLNLLVPVACLLQPTRAALDRLGVRMLLAMVLCLAAFLWWPTRLATARPDVGMPWAPLYDALRAFDGAYNLVPSLHVALTWLVWDSLRAHMPGRTWRWAWAAACAMIALSTLTTGQHHLIDVGAGALVGVAVQALVRGPGPQS